MIVRSRIHNTNDMKINAMDFLCDTLEKNNSLPQK